MMFLDSRVGSKDLLDPMRRFGIPVELTTLDYGDATWLGKGPDGPLPVGVELKTIGDLLSSLVSGRLTGHQIPGMVQQYHQVWLVVEGMVKPDRETGELQQFRGSGWRPIELGRRRFTYHDFSAFLATLETKAGVHVRQTEGRWETACLLASLYRWWQKDWESHRGHLAFEPVLRDTALLSQPSLLRRLAKELPGVGWTKSAEVEAHFKTVDRMTSATEADWVQIKGIGKTLAGKIVAMLHAGAGRV